MVVSKERNGGDFSRLFLFSWFYFLLAPEWIETGYQRGFVDNNNVYECIYF